MTKHSEGCIIPGSSLELQDYWTTVTQPPQRMLPFTSISPTKKEKHIASHGSITTTIEAMQNKILYILKGEEQQLQTDKNPLIQVRGETAPGSGTACSAQNSYWLCMNLFQWYIMT